MALKLCRLCWLDNHHLNNINNVFNKMKSLTMEPVYFDYECPINLNNFRLECLIVYYEFKNKNFSISCPSVCMVNSRPQSIIDSEAATTQTRLSSFIQDYCVS